MSSLKEFDATDIRASVVAAISIKVQEPVFESQTKTKLGSLNIGPDGPTVRTFINDFLKKELDDYLHKHADAADGLLKRIMQSERERKDIAGIKKLANERAKRPLYTTENSAIARFTSMMMLNRQMKDAFRPRFSLPRVIRHRVLLPSPGMLLLKRYSV